jgi:hypothetical protein
MSESPTALKQARQHIKDGNRREALLQLKQVVQTHPKSKDAELAWFWMAKLLQEPTKKKKCLVNVLKLNPNHKSAKEELRNLTAQQTKASIEEPRLDEILPPVQSVQKPSSLPQADQSPVTVSKPHSKTKGFKKPLLWGCGILTLLGVPALLFTIVFLAGMLPNNDGDDASAARPTLPPTYTLVSSPVASGIQVSLSELTTHFANEHGFEWYEREATIPNAQHWSGYSDASAQRKLIIWTHEETGEILELFYSYSTPSGVVSGELARQVMIEQRDVLALTFPDWSKSASWLEQATDDFSQSEGEVHRTEIDGYIVELDLGPEVTSNYFSGILSIYTE